jgi:hypothetical protein
MSEADFIRIAAAYRRAALRTAEQVLNVWMFGSTNPHLIAVEFCAADFVLEVLPS